MRLYYYMSPLDLIQHHQASNKSNEAGGRCFDVTYKILSSLTIDQLIKNDLGSYLSISLMSTEKNESKIDTYSLPDCSLLNLNEATDDERTWTDAFGSYFNNNFSFEKYK